MSAIALDVWSAERCASLLAKAKRTPNGWHACCPAHADRNPSLFLADGDDGLALVCYAGCAYRDIVQALETKGAVLREPNIRRDLPPLEHYQLGPYSDHWDYLSPTGSMLMRVCRWEQPGSKDIRPLTRTGDGWKWQHHPNPRPLFQLDRLANEPNLPVLLVEGEKTALAAQRLFPCYVATTWPGGAQAMGQADTEPLRGRDVVLVPDCDVPGRKAMQWWSQRLKGHAKSARIVDPARIATGLPEGWDFADALAEGRDVSGWLGAPQAEQAAQLATFPLLWYTALQSFQQQRQLIKALLLTGTLAVVYGESNTGKTFLVLDVALAIARGNDWRGRRTRRGLVLYVAGEGAASVRARVAAYHMVNPDLGGLPFAVISQPVDFRSAESIDRLLTTIKMAEVETGETAALIIIDTLARAMPGGDENSSEDMGTVIAFAHQLRTESGAAVVFVHHSGKDPSKGARGSSALRAAADTEILVEGLTGTRTATVSKQRDLPVGEPMPFELSLVQIGIDEDDGSAITSCVVKHVEVDNQPARQTVARLRGRAQRQFLTVLRQRAAEQSVWTLFDLRQLGKSIGMSKSTTRCVVDAIVASPYMQASIGGFKFTDGEPATCP